MENIVGFINKKNKNMIVVILLIGVIWTGLFGNWISLSSAAKMQFNSVPSFYMYESLSGDGAGMAAMSMELIEGGGLSVYEIMSLTTKITTEPSFGTSYYGDETVSYIILSLLLTAMIFFGMCTCVFLVFKNIYSNTKYSCKSVLITAIISLVCMFTIVNSINNAVGSDTVNLITSGFSTYVSLILAVVAWYVGNIDTDVSVVREVEMVPNPYEAFKKQHEIGNFIKCSCGKNNSIEKNFCSKCGKGIIKNK